MLGSTGSIERMPRRRRDRRGTKLIEIKIVNLKAGANNGILFACNPHSAMGDATSTTMLGVIVLDETKDK